MKNILIVILVAMLSACVPVKKYEWGPYSQGLYDYYKEPATEEKFVVHLKSHIDDLEIKGKKPAPGLYAEVGTLYLNLDKTQEAIKYYELERNAWPESKPLMDVLIKNLSEG